MDTADFAEKCENLMNVVVESRKQFGKKCVEYGVKASIIEQKLFDSYLESISKRKFRSKTAIPEINLLQTSTEYDNFNAEFDEHTQRIKKLRKRIADTNNILDKIRHNQPVSRIPLTKESILEFREKRLAVVDGNFK